MATHGRSGLKRWVYGSVTDKTLHGGHASMLIIRPGTQMADVPAAGVGVERGQTATPERERQTGPAAALATAMAAALEQVYLEAYLREKGYTLHSVKELPADESRRLLAEASVYASARRAEIETKSHLVREL